MPNPTPTRFEKCTEEIKVRVPEQMRDAIMRLAFSADRSPSEYVRHVLAVHLYGHVRQFADEAEPGTGPNVPSEGTRKIRGA